MAETPAEDTAENPADQPASPRPNVCIVCAKDLEEPLVSPLTFTKTKALEVYQVFLANYRYMVDHGVPVQAHVPPDISAEELYQRQAAYHKSCRLLFCKSTAERAVKVHLNKLEREKNPKPPPLPKPVKPIKKQEEPKISANEHYGAFFDRDIKDTNYDLCILCQEELAGSEPKTNSVKELGNRRISRIGSQARMDKIRGIVEDLKYFNLMARLAEGDWKLGNLR